MSLCGGLENGTGPTDEEFERHIVPYSEVRSIFNRSLCEFMVGNIRYRALNRTSKVSSVYKTFECRVFFTL